MLRLRPYLQKDTEKILSWCRDEQTHYKWTAGVMGEYPLTPERFEEKALSTIAFCLLEEKEVIGFFTMRNPGETPDELRIGFVILDPAMRGRGLGKEMLQLGLKYATEIYKARKVTLGVFENNPAAHHCYLSAGFRDIPTAEVEAYPICGEIWNCIQMEYIPNR